MSEENLGFDPDDLAEMEEKFARIKRDSTEGYTVEFIMTKLAAKDIVRTWLKALMGEKPALQQCMANYAYIVEEIMFALEEDEGEDFTY